MPCMLMMMLWNSAELCRFPGFLMCFKVLSVGSEPHAGSGTNQGFYGCYMGVSQN